MECLKVKVKSLSCAQLFATPWTVAYQAPLSMGFFRQEYWSGLPFPSPADQPPHAKSWLIGKDSDAGRDWGQEEKGMTEDEMAGWHHWPDGCEFEWTPGVGDGQGGLACCDSWGRKESDTTEWLNWTELRKSNNNNVAHIYCFNTCLVIHNYI